MNKFSYYEDEEFSTALIYKQDVGVFVLLYRKVVAVISTTKFINDQKDAPLILLYKECNGSKSAYEKFLHVIGKMIKKTNSTKVSKYFDGQRVDEHLRNGMHGGEDQKLVVTIEEIASYLVNDLLLRIKDGVNNG